MNVLPQIALFLASAVVLLLLVFRPRVLGALALPVFLWIGVVEARNGHFAGVCNAVLYGFALGVMPFLTHFDDPHRTRSIPKS